MDIALCSAPHAYGMPALIVLYENKAIISHQGSNYTEAMEAIASVPLPMALVP